MKISLPTAHNQILRNEARWVIQQRVHKYEPFPGENIFFPGLTTRHEIHDLQGNPLCLGNEHTVPYSGIEVSKHDVISHGSSLTTGSGELGELINVGFQFFLKGGHIELDNPQPSEEALYPKLWNKLSSFLSQSLTSTEKQFIQETQQKLEEAYLNHLKPMLSFNESHLKTNLEETKFKAIFTFPEEYVSTVFKSYNAFFEEAGQEFNLNIAAYWEMFQLSKKENFLNITEK